MHPLKHVTAERSQHAQLKTRGNRNLAMGAVRNQQGARGSEVRLLNVQQKAAVEKHLGIDFGQVFWIELSPLQRQPVGRLLKVGIIQADLCSKKRLAVTDLMHLSQP